MTATFIFGRDLRSPNELPLPQHHEVVRELLAYTAMGANEGGVFVPLADIDNSPGIVPQGNAHYSKDGEQIQPGDRPPLCAYDNGFKALLHAVIHYASYSEKVGLPYNAGIDLERENGFVVGYPVFVSAALKNILLSEEGVQLRPRVLRISAASFEPQLAVGKGNSYYASADTELEVLGEYDVDLSMLGEKLWPLAEDPITSDKIRKYYKELKVRTEEGITKGVRLQEITEYERSHPTPAD
jgi:hypothetical protein